MTLEQFKQNYLTAGQTVYLHVFPDRKVFALTTLTLQTWGENNPANAWLYDKPDSNVFTGSYEILMIKKNQLWATSYGREAVVIDLKGKEVQFLNRQMDTGYRAISFPILDLA